MSPFGRLSEDLLAFDHVEHGFGDVGGMVADPLDVLGAEHQMDAERDVARVFHHVGQQFAEQRGADGVDFLVALPDRHRRRQIVRRIGVEHGLDLRLHEIGHVLEAADQLQRLEIALQRRDPLAHVLGEIADPLEIGGDPHRADDLAQVHRHRLAPGDGQHRALLDHALQIVDFGVGGDDALAERDVAADQRIDGIDDHAFGETAHLGDQPGQFLQIAVERLGGMFGAHLVLPQPNRPVM